MCPKSLSEKHFSDGKKRQVKEQPSCQDLILNSCVGQRELVYVPAQEFIFMSKKYSDTKIEK